ncbi:hypothetical protein [Alteromonas antoniana]|uniref:hypothetical protein n=1 Tax=Alteromonas antoniana TaxID=2803813 RepID=UPI001C44DB8B|nr:hypothetical protein [Alteromonas antoniana]
MLKHESINNTLFVETANQYMDFILKFLNEYSGDTFESLTSSEVGTDGLIRLFERLFELGVKGKILEGEMLPSDLEDIAMLAKMERLTASFEGEALCSLLDEALNGRIKLCLYDNLPLGKIYDLPEQFDHFENIAGLDLTINELAALANMAPRSVRNDLLSAPKGKVYKSESGNQLVDVAFCQEWLKSRKDYKPTKNLSGMSGLHNEYVNVPVATDGTMFSSMCEYKRGGYTIGEKGDEIKVHSFEEALHYLTSMPHAKWRRPNSVGNYGLVSAVEWRRVKRSEVI